MKWAYYNENDPYCCEWLRNLIRAGLIPDGEVDERSIELVQPDDVRGFAQAHWFSGIGGWAYACRLAGWPDDRKIWTGSLPCQPFSVAGKGKGVYDDRHLWPDFFRLIRAVRPPVVMGEQTSGKAGYGWLDGVRSDLAGEGYASRGLDIPACAVDGPHRRNRIYWVAKTLDDAASARCDRSISKAEGETRDEAWMRVPCEGDGKRRALEHFAGERWREGRAEHGLRSRGNAASGAGCSGEGWQQRSGELSWISGDSNSCLGRNRSFWSDAEWLAGADGKARRVGVGIRRVDHGLPAGMDSLRPTEEAAASVHLLSRGEPARVSKIRGLGNAIVPQLAAEAIRAFMECSDD